jgi:hypothetical protein
MGIKVDITAKRGRGSRCRGTMRGIQKGMGMDKDKDKHMGVDMDMDMMTGMGIMRIVTVPVMMMAMVCPRFRFLFQFILFLLELIICFWNEGENYGSPSSQNYNTNHRNSYNNSYNSYNAYNSYNTHHQRHVPYPSSSRAPYSTHPSAYSSTDIDVGIDTIPPPPNAPKGPRADRDRVRASTSTFPSTSAVPVVPDKLLPTGPKADRFKTFVPKILHPSEEYVAASLQPSERMGSDEEEEEGERRKLLVLDLNGSLLVRAAHKAKAFVPNVPNAAPQPFEQRTRPTHPRPYMPTFRSYLSHPLTKKWLDVMVWSSAMPHSVRGMVGEVFGNGAWEKAGDFERRFARKVEEDENEELEEAREDTEEEEEEEEWLKRYRELDLKLVWARDTLGLERGDYSECTFLYPFDSFVLCGFTIAFLHVLFAILHQYLPLPRLLAFIACPS